MPPNEVPMYEYWQNAKNPAGIVLRIGKIFVEVCFPVCYNFVTSCWGYRYPEEDEGGTPMFVKEVVVNNPVGLRARPATFFTQKANEFKCSVWIQKDERKVNAKSLLGVLSLGITKDTTVTIVADGDDEEQACETLCELISKEFAE